MIPIDLTHSLIRIRVEEIKQHFCMFSHLMYMPNHFVFNQSTFCVVNTKFGVYKCAHECRAII